MEDFIIKNFVDVALEDLLEIPNQEVPDLQWKINEELFEISKSVAPNYQAQKPALMITQSNPKDAGDSYAISKENMEGFMMRVWENKFVNIPSSLNEKIKPAIKHVLAHHVIKEAIPHASSLEKELCSEDDSIGSDGRTRTLHAPSVQMTNSQPIPLGFEDQEKLKKKKTTSAQKMVVMNMSFAHPLANAKRKDSGSKRGAHPSRKKAKMEQGLERAGSKFEMVHGMRGLTASDLIVLGIGHYGDYIFG